MGDCLGTGVGSNFPMPSSAPRVGIHGRDPFQVAVISKGSLGSYRKGKDMDISGLRDDYGDSPLGVILRNCHTFLVMGTKKGPPYFVSGSGNPAPIIRVK